MTPEQIKEIIEKHKKWINNEEGGERANFTGAFCRDTNFCDAELEGTNFEGAIFAPGWKITRIKEE